MANIKDLIKSISASETEFSKKLDSLQTMEETQRLEQAKTDKAIQENVDLIVEAIRVMERKVQAQLEDVKAIIPEKGDQGAAGRDGRQGQDGKPGANGAAGQRGRDGVDGADGVSVADAKIDFDGALVITLSTGQEINVGEVVAPELAERIKVISSMSTNGAVGIKDEGNTVSTGVKNINFVGASVTATASGDDVTVNVSSGTGTVTSVAVSGGTTGLTTTGGPITTTGTISLAGTLAVANGGTGVTTSTGTGNVVLSNSPTLVTPTLGVASATSLTTTGTINLLTVGRGLNAVATNTAVGTNALGQNTSGAANTAVGNNTLFSNTIGDANTAIGFESLKLNTIGNANTAIGLAALQKNVSGFQNTALGVSALLNNTIGDFNTAVGVSTLNGNISGDKNTGIGESALFFNTGSNNVAIGYQALFDKTSGDKNTAVGEGALFNLDNTSFNTAIGFGAGFHIETGAKNTILGTYNGNQGGLDIRTLSNHIVLSDGDGNPRGQFNASGVFSAPAGIANTPINGTVGATTPAAGSFTTIGASSTATLNTLSSSGATLTGGSINGMTVGATTPSTGAFTTLTTSSTVTHNGGTANGVAFLNASKVLTTGSALVFNGSQLNVNGSFLTQSATILPASGAGTLTLLDPDSRTLQIKSPDPLGTQAIIQTTTNHEIVFGINSVEKMRLTSTGLKSSIAGTNADPVFSNTADTNTGIFFPAADKLGFTAGGGVDQMVLTSTGLGIGTSSPGVSLQVGDASTSGKSILLRNGGGASRHAYIQLVGTTAVSADQTWYAGINPFATDGSYEIKNAAGAGLTLDTSGNVGIGTSSPATGPSGAIANVKLALLNGVANQNNGTSVLLIGGDGNHYSSITAEHTSGGNTYLAFGTSTGAVNPTEKARISADGTFRVKGAGSAGTTDAFQVAGGAPADAARIDSSGNLLVGTASVIESGIISVSNIGGTTFGAQINATGSGIVVTSQGLSNTCTAASFKTNSGVVGSITCGSTTAYNTTSDYRLKTVIGPVANAGQRIDALQPVEYTWNASGERTRGFLAHQFAGVYAGSVSGTKDAVDAEGKPVYQAMQASTSEVIADLVAMLQEHRAEIASLKTRLAAAGI